MGKTKIHHNSGIGGQAVLEGVMMRNKEKYAVACRKPDGGIDIQTYEYHSFVENSVLLRIPFVRGIFVFIDSLVIGMRALDHSTSFYEDEESSGKVDKFLDKATHGHADRFVSIATYIFSFALAIGLFMILPYFLAQWLTSYVRNESLLTLIEGLVRIGIFILYILLISRMKEIRRLFRYHGAEHKCINCLEHGYTLTPAHVKAASRLHRRCGSSFLLFVMMISIILFFFIQTDSLVLRLVYRILLIPVISGISYEFLRLAGNSDAVLVRVLSAPGLALQRLTTAEPDDEMIEVGIASVEAVFDWKSYLKDGFGYDFDNEVHEMHADTSEKVEEA